MGKISYTRRQAVRLGLSGIAGLSLLDLAACGGGSASPTNETMQLSFWGDASRNKLTQAAITAFHKDHANITIKSWYADFTNYFTKLNTQIAGGSSPDLIQMDMSYVKQYADQKLLLDLKPFIDNKTIDLSDFDQNMLSNSEYNKTNYGISLGGNYECFIYDSQLVQDAGVSKPPTTWTWDDFASYTSEVSKALSSKGIFGTPDASGAMDVFEIWVRQRGNEVYTADGKVGFTVDDVASWFNYWDGLRKSGACAGAALQATVTGSGPAASLLAKGKAVFASGHSNQFSAYQVVTPHQLVLQQLPTGSGPGLYLKPSMLMSISPKSKYQQDAATFINFLITQAAGVKAIGLDRGIPGSVRARADLQPGLKAVDKAVLTYADAVAKSGQNRPKSVLDPTGAGTILTNLGKVAQSVAFGQVSISDGATKFYQDSQTTLAKA